MEGVNEVVPGSTHKDFPVWEQATSRVLYCLASCVHTQMLGYIRDARTPKEARENLKKIFAASTTARKLQLRQELNNIRQRDMTVTDYTTKIKEICDALGSINMTVDEDEMVQICLGGLAQRYGLIRTAIWRSHCRFLTYNQCFWSKKTTRVRQGAHNPTTGVVHGGR